MLPVCYQKKPQRGPETGCIPLVIITLLNSR